MKKRIIFTLGKTDVLIHPAVVIFWGYAYAAGYARMVIISLLSIFLHEIAHAAAAIIFGQMPQRIELSIIGAAVHLEDDEKLSTFQRFVVILSGPFTTGILCHLAIILTKNNYLPHAIGGTLFMSNLALLLMNLLPALPLDGGRCVALLLGIKFTSHTVSRIMRILGNMIGISLIVINVIVTTKFGGWNLSLSLCGCFVLYCTAVGTSTYVYEEYKMLLQRKIHFETRQMQKTIWLSVPTCAHLRNVIRNLPHNRLAIYICYELGSMRLVGWLTENTVIHQYLSSPYGTISDVLMRYPHCQIGNPAQSEEI